LFALTADSPGPSLLLKSSPTATWDEPSGIRFPNKTSSGVGDVGVWEGAECETDDKLYHWEKQRQIKARTARFKQTLGDKGCQLANLLIDIVSAASLDCVVALTAASTLFVCNHRPKQRNPSLILLEEA
jgi:hypothetical protein